MEAERSRKEEGGVMKMSTPHKLAYHCFLLSAVSTDICFYALSKQVKLLQYYKALACRAWGVTEWFDKHENNVSGVLESL